MSSLLPTNTESIAKNIVIVNNDNNDKTCIRQIHSVSVVDESAKENDKNITQIEAQEAKRVNKTDFLVMFLGKK